MEPVVLAFQAAALPALAISLAAALVLAGLVFGSKSRAWVRAHSGRAAAVWLGWTALWAAALVIPTPVDRCLDSGGRWNEALAACEYEIGPRFGLRPPRPPASAGFRRAAPAPA